MASMLGFSKIFYSHTCKVQFLYFQKSRLETYSECLSRRYDWQRENGLYKKESK